MTLFRLPEPDQLVNRLACPDAEHNPPQYAAVEPGSYMHSCPTCGASVRVEVSRAPFYYVAAATNSSSPATVLGTNAKDARK